MIFIWVLVVLKPIIYVVILYYNIGGVEEMQKGADNCPPPFLIVIIEATSVHQIAG